MEITLTLGWWIAPATITLACLAYIIFANGYASQASDPVSSLAGGVLDLLTIGVAVIISLVAWLVWAIMN